MSLCFAFTRSEQNKTRSLSQGLDEFIYRSMNTWLTVATSASVGIAQADYVTTTVDATLATFYFL